MKGRVDDTARALYGPPAMNILLISERESLDGSGDALCRLTHALPKALTAQDHAVAIVTPRYQGMDPATQGMARRLSTLDVEREGTKYSLVIHEGRTAAGVERIVLDAPELFGEVEALTESKGDVALRLGVFAAAVEQLVEMRDPRVEVAHGIGAVGGLALAALAASERATDVARVLTFDRIEPRPTFETSDAAKLGDLPGLEQGGRLDPMAAGVRAAGRVATLSATYARAITAEDGGDLSGLLSGAEGGLRGILSGVDASTHSPLTDPHLPARYDAMDTRGKADTKARVQQKLELPLRPEVPVFLAYGFEEGDGLELLVEATKPLLRNDLQLVVRTFDDDARVQALREAGEAWPDRLKVLTGKDEKRDHELMGAADFLIAPHPTAPAGLLPMIGQRYGTLPIARSVGAVQDFVVDCDANLETGTGLLFDEATADSLLAACQRGAAAFLHEGFKALRQRVMRIDHSWDRAGRVYSLLYRELLEPEGSDEADDESDEG